MFLIGQSIETILKNIDSKLENKQDYEALIYSVFSFERMVRRTINFMFREAGYHPKFINQYILGKDSDWRKLKELFKLGNLYSTGEEDGINEILTRPIWKMFDNSNEPLGAMQIRNKIAHGIVPKRAGVQASAQNMKLVINKWDSWCSSNLGYNGTGKLLFKKSKVKIPFPTVKT